MMVDLNEQELFALMVLVNTDRLEKKTKGVEDTIKEECLEMKLVEALLKETGQFPPQFTDSQRSEAIRLLEEHRKQEEQRG